MIKSELVQRIAERNPHLYLRDVENIVNAILDEITHALSRGDRVELRGFGAFSVKRRDARLGRNLPPHRILDPRQRHGLGFDRVHERFERIEPAPGCRTMLAQAALLCGARTFLPNQIGVVTTARLPSQSSKNPSLCRDILPKL